MEINSFLSNNSEHEEDNSILDNNVQSQCDLNNTDR